MLKFRAFVVDKNRVVTSSSIAISAEEKYPPASRPQGVSRGPASPSGGKSNLATASEVFVDPKTGRPAKGESLKELLRSRMAEKENAEKEGQGSGPRAAAAAQKSSFDQFFEEKGKVGDETKIAGADGAGGGNSQPGFFLSGSETDRVVAKLAGSLNAGSEQAADERVFGSSEVNIFQRMTSCLRKGEREKRVAKN